MTDETRVGAQFHKRERGGAKPGAGGVTRAAELGGGSAQVSLQGVGLAGEAEVGDADLGDFHAGSGAGGDQATRPSGKRSQFFGS